MSETFERAITTGELVMKRLLAMLAIVHFTTATAQVTPEIVGRVVSAVGEVTVVRQNGDVVAAERALDLMEGDRIQTATNGLAQLRFADGAIMVLRCESELHLARYDIESSGVIELELTSGGVRTITGSGAAANYTLRVGEALVKSLGSEADFRVIAEGPLHEFGVFQGAIRISNALGELELSSASHMQAPTPALETKFTYAVIETGAAPRGTILPTLNAPCSSLTPQP